MGLRQYGVKLEKSFRSCESTITKILKRLHRLFYWQAKACRLKVNFITTKNSYCFLNSHKGY